MANRAQKVFTKLLRLGMVPALAILFVACNNPGSGGRSPGRTIASSALTISPTTATVAVGRDVDFDASGGSGTLRFSVASGSGVINSTTGIFTAATSTGSTTIRVSDAVGNTTTAIVTVLASLTVTASPASSIAINATTTISAAGGTAPYSYAVGTGGAGGTIVAATGVYTAPAAVGTGSDIITATDAAGRTGTITITVGAVLSISPVTHTLAVNNTKTFAAAGGSPPYT